MRFTIENLFFKLYSRYGDNGLAKAYVIYSINYERALNVQEWNILSNAMTNFTLRKNRLYIERIWQQGKTIYFIGKQSHGLGYSWDKEVLDALYPIFNSFKA